MKDLKVAFLVFWFLGLLGHLSSIASPGDPPPPPARWRANLAIDQQLNQVAYEPLANKKPVKIIPVIHLDLPRTYPGLKLTKSRYLDPIGGELIAPNPKNFRLFFIDPEHPVLKSLLSSGFVTEPTLYWATQQTSHNTFLVWDKDSRAVSFMKFHCPDFTNSSPKSAQAAVRMSDYAETVLRRDSKSPSNPNFFPERWAVTLEPQTSKKNPTLFYSVSGREVEPLFKPKGYLLPAHSMIDLYKNNQFNGPFWREWRLTKVFPVLARSIADLWLRHGLVPEAHAQNIVLDVSLNDGTVNGIVFKDAFDTMVDFSARYSGGRKQSYRFLLRGQNDVSRARWHHVGIDAPSSASVLMGYLESFLGADKKDIDSVWSKEDTLFWNLLFSEIKLIVSEFTQTKLISLIEDTPEFKKLFNKKLNLNRADILMALMLIENSFSFRGTKEHQVPFYPEHIVRDLKKIMQRHYTETFYLEPTLFFNELRFSENEKTNVEKFLESEGPESSDPRFAFRILSGEIQLYHLDLENEDSYLVASVRNITKKDKAIIRKALENLDTKAEGCQELAGKLLGLLHR